MNGFPVFLSTSLKGREKKRRREKEAVHAKEEIAFCSVTINSSNETSYK